jgi:hypothetical protein
LADWCTIDVRNARGELVRVAVAQTEFPCDTDAVDAQRELADARQRGNQTLRIPLSGQEDVLAELTLARK